MLVASVDDEQVCFSHPTKPCNACSCMPVRLPRLVRSRALGGQATGEDDLPTAEQELRTSGEHRERTIYLAVRRAPEFALCHVLPAPMVESV